MVTGHGGTHGCCLRRSVLLWSPGFIAYIHIARSYGPGMSEKAMRKSCSKNCRCIVFRNVLHHLMFCIRTSRNVGSGTSGRQNGAQSAVASGARGSRIRKSSLSCGKEKPRVSACHPFHDSALCSNTSRACSLLNVRAYAVCFPSHCYNSFVAAIRMVSNNLVDTAQQQTRRAAPATTANTPEQPTLVGAASLDRFALACIPRRKDLGESPRAKVPNLNCRMGSGD